MCKGGGTKTSSTIDPRVFGLLSGNYNRALALGNQPFQPYTGERVAAPSAGTLQAQNMILSGAPMAGASTLDSAIAAAQRAAAWQPQRIEAPVAEAPAHANAHSAGPANLAGATPAAAAQIDRTGIRDLTAESGLAGLDAYLNPYLSSVVDAALKDLGRARDLGVTANTSAAAATPGAFGGSRHGVAEAETNRAFFDAAARTAAQLRASGFDSGAALLMSDRDRNLHAGAANQAADLTAAAQNARMANDVGLANAAAANDVSRFNASAANDMTRFNAANAHSAALANLDAGTRLSLANQHAALQAALANQSAGRDAARLGFDAAALLGGLSAQELSTLLTRGGAIGEVGAQQQLQRQNDLDAQYEEFLRALQFPYLQQQMLNQALGLVSGAGGTQQTIQKPQSNTLGQIGSFMQGAAALTAAVSDERLKTDIETAGYDSRGRRWVTFRYLWDSPGTQRHGVIAQEIERTDPTAVIDTPFGKLVDYAQLPSP